MVESLIAHMLKSSTLILKKVTDKTVHQLLGKVDAILVPGGFGPRGVEGKDHRDQICP